MEEYKFELQRLSPNEYIDTNNKTNDELYELINSSRKYY